LISFSGSKKGAGAKALRGRARVGKVQFSSVPFGQALSQLVLCGKQDRSNAEDALLIPISQISVSGLGPNSKSGIFPINRLRSRFA
jgi:hypothetical protein